MPILDIDEETLDVLYDIKPRSDGTVAIKFINGNGEKVPWVVSGDAARDLCDELTDLTFGD